MLNIVVVEAVDVLRDALVGCLNRPGWQAVGVGSGQALGDWLQDHRADIVVLDLNLPDEDGLSIARRLRQRWPQLGIVMLTDRGSHAQRAAGFAHGADVYLSKPAQTVEIEAVIRNLQRRIEIADAPLPSNSPSNVLRLASQHLRLSSAPGASMELTEQEACLLMQLVRGGPQAVGLDALQQALTAAGFGEPGAGNLRVRITRLRAKMKPLCGGSDPIQSVRGQGYRLTIPVTVV